MCVKGWERLPSKRIYRGLFCSVALYIDPLYYPLKPNPNLLHKTTPMAWTYLIIAGLFEVVWAISIKYTEGFTRLYYSMVTVLAMGCSMYFLAKALKFLPIGTAYAVWTGIGVLGTAIIGILFLGEPHGMFRVLCIFLLIIAILGLKFTS
jgi:quaternary ammonium compound-resistance protein SugE